MKKFRNKYRVSSTRLSNWDYSSNGYYFVTICTKGLKCVFGEIKNGIMGLSEMGCATAQFWNEIPKHFPSVTLDEWVVMSNHVHGIIGLCPSSDHCRDAINRVSTAGGGITGNKNPMGKNVLGGIVRWLKGRTSFEIHKIYHNFSWQSRFHDHIIRNEKSLGDIREYIRNNPLKWEYDRNNPNYPWK